MGQGRMLERDEKRVLVVGLGRFGMSAARTLATIGYEVLAVDINPKAVADAAEHVALAAEGDGTDEELLRSLGADQCRYAIVGQGENLEVSVLATLVLKRIGVPWVVAKATGDLHGELLRRIGADLVVFAERDAGVRVGHTLSVRSISDYITLGPFTGVAKLTAPASFVGQTLGTLCADHTKSLQVLVVKRGETVITHPGDDERVRAGDELIVVGADPAIDAFAAPDKAKRGAARDGQRE